MTLFKFICVQYQFHGQTLPIMKIDRGQIKFREYVSTGTEAYDDVTTIGNNRQVRVNIDATLVVIFRITETEILKQKSVQM